MEEKWKIWFFNVLCVSSEPSKKIFIQPKRHLWESFFSHLQKSAEKTVEIC